MRNDRFGLQADVDDDDVVGDVDHEAGEDHARADALVGQALFEQFGETFGHTLSRTALRRDAWPAVRFLEPRELLTIGAASLPRPVGKSRPFSMAIPCSKNFDQPAQGQSARCRPSSSTRSTTVADGQARRIEDHRILRGTQRRDGAGRIPQVALGYLPRKGGKANSRPLVFQLLMAPSGPFFGAGGQEDLEARPAGRPRCPCRARRPPGPGAAAKARCRSSSAGPHRRPGGDPRGALPASSGRIGG